MTGWPRGVMVGLPVAGRVHVRPARLSAEWAVPKEWTAMVGGQMQAAVPQVIEATAKRRNLAGKVALVTGGSRGLGAAIACALAADGADVAISYESSAAKAEAVVHDLEAMGVQAVAFEADQADPAQVAALVNGVVEHFGHLDILVNNAGVLRTGAVGDPASDPAAFARQVAINIAGVAAAVRAAAPIMGEGGGSSRSAPLPRRTSRMVVSVTMRPARQQSPPIVGAGPGTSGHAASP